MPPSRGANALLHPPRRTTSQVPTLPFERVRLDVAPGVRLVGWLFRTPKPRRGTLAGPKKLVLVPGAHHHDAPAPGAWPAIDASVASSWTQSD